jgi:hypothetical protein
MGNSTMKTSNQLDGANDEVISSNCRKKKSKIIEISLQLDGTGPPVSYFTFLFELSFVLCRLVMMKMKMMKVK